MKRTLILLSILILSLSSKAWIDSVFWNKAVLPHTVQTIGQFNQGTHIKSIDQYFLNGSDTLSIDLVFVKCYGPASLYDWDTLVTISTSILSPNYCLMLRIISDSNTQNNNCYIQSRFIDTFYMDCNAPLSFAESNKSDHRIQFYPNPVKDRLAIKIEDNRTANSLYIYSIFGVQIKKLKFINDVDVSELAAGVYLIAVQTEDGAKWGKFVKE